MIKFYGKVRALIFKVQQQNNSREKPQSNKLKIRKSASFCHPLK